MALEGAENTQLDEIWDGLSKCMDNNTDDSDDIEYEEGGFDVYFKGQFEDFLSKLESMRTGADDAGVSQIIAYLNEPLDRVTYYAENDEGTTIPRYKVLLDKLNDSNLEGKAQLLQRLQALNPQNLQQQLDSVAQPQGPQKGKVNPFYVPFEEGPNGENPWTAINQADLIMAEIDRQVANRQKVAITYAANSAQTERLMGEYSQEQGYEIVGGRQAVVMAEVYKRLKSDPKYQDKVHILPISTLDDSNGPRKPATMEQVDGCLENVAAHCGNDWVVLGLQNETSRNESANHFAIGGGEANRFGWQDSPEKQRVDLQLAAMAQGNFNDPKMNAAHLKGKNVGVPLKENEPRPQPLINRGQPEPNRAVAQLVADRPAGANFKTNIRQAIFDNIKAQMQTEPDADWQIKGFHKGIDQSEPPNRIKMGKGTSRNMVSMDLDTGRMHANTIDPDSGKLICMAAKAYRDEMQRANPGSPETSFTLVADSKEAAQKLLKSLDKSGIKIKEIKINGKSEPDMLQRFNQSQQPKKEGNRLAN